MKAKQPNAERVEGTYPLYMKKKRITRAQTFAARALVRRAKARVRKRRYGEPAGR